jgi:hypothetical protein
MRVSDSFRYRADDAAFWEAWVAACLTRAGLTVMVHPWTMDDARDHGQDMDLSIVESTPDGWSVVADPEVKSLGLAYSSPEDYPYEVALICSEASFLRKAPAATSDVLYTTFMLVSQHTGAIIVAPHGTRVWSREVTDRKRGETYVAVCCHRSNLKDLFWFTERCHGR